MFITALYEHVDYEFRTRDFVFLKHGFNAEETDRIDKYLVNIHLLKEYPTMNEFQKKIAEIKELPEYAINRTKAKDILLGYKSDGMYSSVITNILKK